MGNTPGLMEQRVLISDATDPSCVEILREAGLSVDYKPGTSPEELLRIIPDYTGLIVRSSTKVTADVIAAGKLLWLIGRAGTGVDNIDLDAATDRGIIVMNTPFGNTLSAAEHTCAMICTMSRNIPQACALLKSGTWNKKKFIGNELYGKTLGIVGLGRIGREVATRMQSFGMKTIGFDPLVPAEEAAEFNVEWMQLPELWPQVDYVTVHTPLIPATRGLMNDAVFASCKEGVRVVNVARGGIIDEDALLRALESGRCAGAGLDVFVEEPTNNRALVEHERAVVTPHLGASTVEAQRRVAQEIAQQFVAAMKEYKLEGVVNVPFVTQAMLPASEPWVRLATQLGALARAMLPAPPTSITVTISGDTIKGYGRFLLPAVLSGVLDNGVLGQLGGTGNISLLNATAKAKKLSLKSACSYQGGSSCGVVVEVCGGEGGVKAGGVVREGVALLTAVGGHEVAGVELSSGHLLVFQGLSLLEVAKQLPDAQQLVQGAGLVVARAGSKPPGCSPSAALYID